MARLRTHIVSSQPGDETSSQTAIGGEAQMDSLVQYQVEIGRRAQQVFHIPSLAFDSSMTAEEMRSKFQRLRANVSVSNLPDATGKFGHMSQDEVVRRTQLGEFGSTEVPLKQVW